MRIIAAFALVLAACSFSRNPTVNDSPPPTPAARRQADIVAGAGRVKAGVVTMDVEVGRAVPLGTVKAGTVTIGGVSAVQP